MDRRLLLCVMGLLFACGDEAGGSTGTEGGTSSGPTDPTNPTGAPTSSSGSDMDASTGTSATPPPTTGDETSGSGPGESMGRDSESEGDSSGGETTGGVLPRGQWAMTEITYTEGGTTETLTMQDRAFCDATLGGGLLLLRYQQAQGFTVWTVNIPMASGVGSHTLTQDFSGVYMNINEVSDAWMTYFDPSMAFGTLELTDAQIQEGGVVSGTLTASLTSNDGSTTAEFSSTFYAEIP